jgi:hypothetical protein
MWKNLYILVIHYKIGGLNMKKKIMSIFLIGMLLTLSLSVFSVNAINVPKLDEDDINDAETLATNFYFVGYVKYGGGKPVVGATVKIIGVGEGTTNSQGYYEAGSLAPGDAGYYKDHLVSVKYNAYSARYYTATWDTIEQNGLSKEVHNDFTFTPFIKPKTLNVFTRNSFIFNLFNNLGFLKIFNTLF